MGKFNFVSLPDVEVEITSVKEIFSEMEYWLMYPLIEIHECHSNAFLVTLHLKCDTPIEIVEGYVEDGNVTRTPHAFNKIGDKYFDFTLEKFLPSEHFGKDIYIAKRIYTKAEMFSVIAAMGGNCISFEGRYKRKYSYYIDDEGVLHREAITKKEAHID